MIYILQNSFKFMICGIDEAGRGPVLGPLVVAGVCFKPREIQKLEKAGVKDSKLLSASKRKELYELILKLCSSYKVVSLSAKQIDKREVLQKNLNTLEAEAFSKILISLKPDEAYIDSVFRNPQKLRALLAKKSRARLIVEHKADTRYVVVGAASIIAKVLRDKAIKRLESRFKLKLGSGYPSDPATQEFLKKGQDYSFIRQSWAPVKKIKADKEQSRLDSY